MSEGKVTPSDVEAVRTVPFVFAFMLAVAAVIADASDEDAEFTSAAVFTSTAAAIAVVEAAT